MPFHGNGAPLGIPGFAGRRATYVDAVLADAPLLFLRLGDASGTTMTDSSGNNRSGTYNGSPTLGTTGLIAGGDTAVSFSGAGGQYGLVNYDSSWMNAASFTWEAWIKPSSISGTQDFFCHSHTSLTSRWIARVSGTGIEFYTWSGSAWTSISTSATAGTIYHVAGTYDGTNMRLYKDGVLQSTSGSVGVSTSAVGFGIAGSANGAELYNGVSDEYAFYGTALSASQLLAHSNAGR